MKTAHEKIAGMDHDVIVINPEDFNNNFWKNNYHISLGAIGTRYFAINADNEQDAIDYLIDYLEEREEKWPGYLMDEDEEIEQAVDGFLDEYIQGGNHGRYLSFRFDEIQIEKL